MLWWHAYIRASSSNGYHPLSRVAALTLLTIPHCNKRFDNMNTTKEKGE
jgi:hypothetical protein